MEVFSEEGWERGKEMASLGLESLTFWPPSFPYVPSPPHIRGFPHFPYVPYLSWQTDLSVDVALSLIDQMIHTPGTAVAGTCFSIGIFF